MKLFVLTALILMLGVIDTKSEKLFLLGHNESAYPKVSTELFMFNDSYEPIFTASPNSLVVKDYDKEYSITKINQDSNPKYTNYNLYISIDMAIGSDGSGKSRFLNAIEIAKNVINNTLMKGNAKIALTYYDYMSYLAQDLTKDKDSLMNAFQHIKNSTTSNYKAELTEGPCSALSLFSNSGEQQVLLIITDGFDTTPTDDMILKAKALNASIYIIQIDNEISDNFSKLAIETGGKVLKFKSEDDVQTVSATASYLTMGYNSAILEFDAKLKCDNQHKITISDKSNTSILEFQFESNETNLPFISSAPEYLGFSAVKIGEVKTLPIRITANNGDIYIKNIKIIEGDDINIPIGGDKLTISKGKVQDYLLTAGNSIDLEITYKPKDVNKDSALVFTKLTVETEDACFGKEVFVSAGYPSKEPIGKRTIEILNPYSKQKLFVGDKATVFWTGLLPTDMVHLAFSSDNGKSWDTTYNIYGYYDKIKAAVGYDFVVKNEPSDTCLFRIIQLWPNHLGKTIELKHDNEVKSAFFSHDNLNELVVTASRDMKIRVWETNTGHLDWVGDKHTSTVNYAEFSHNDQYIISASEDNTAILWDAFKKDAVYTFTHKNKVSAAKFTPDDKYVVTSTYDDSDVGKDGLTIWDLNTRKVVASKDLKYNGFAQFIYHFDIHPKRPSLIMASNSGGVLWFWDYITNEEFFVHYLDTFQLQNTGILGAYHCSFNPKGDKFALTFLDVNHNISIWSLDYLNNKVKYQYSLDTAKTGDGISAYFADNATFGEMLLISNKYKDSCGTVIWDVLKNEQHPFFRSVLSEHKRPVSTSSFNFDTKILLTASLDGTAKLWYSDQNSVQQDTSDLFKIGYQKLAGFNQNLEYTPIGFKKDTMIKSFIYNPTGGKIKIKKIDITAKDNDNKNAFSILSDNPFMPFELDSGAKKDYFIRVDPTKQGDLSCKINYTLESNIPDSVFKKGLADSVFAFELLTNSYIPEMISAENTLDFGGVELGDIADVNRQFFIENKSPLDIIINSEKDVMIIGYCKDDFKIVNSGITKYPFAFKSGEKINLKLRFMPKNYGRKNAQLVYSHSGKKIELKINLYGEGIKPILDSITIAASNFSGKAGDEIEVPIFAENVNLAKAKEYLTGFEGLIKFNSTMLAPIGNFEFDTIVGNWRTIKINLPVEPIEGNILAKIKFKVGLGNDTTSQFILEHFIPLGLSKLFIHEKSGIFKMEGLCINDSTPRLFDPNAKIELSNLAPNPIVNDAIMKYELAEESLTKLYITDITGKIVLMLVDQIQTKGKYEQTIFSESLHPGKYFYTLETKNDKITKSFEVVR